MIAAQVAVGAAMNVAGLVALVTAGSVAAPAIAQVIQPYGPPSIEAPVAPRVGGVGILGMADQLLLAGYVYKGCISSPGVASRFLMQAPSGERIFLTAAQVRRSTAKETFQCRGAMTYQSGSEPGHAYYDAR